MIIYKTVAIYQDKPRLSSIEIKLFKQFPPMNLANDVKQQFSTNIIDWYGQHGRKHLPWQQNRTPYRVWISEIMLQQTQVATVIDYYLTFMAKFPTVEALADADIDEVLKLWTGLGYYARARNLHKAAKCVANEYNGVFPTDIDQMQQLPGIGRSTAAAILSLALDLPHPILDGNVKRVMARCFMVEGWYGQAKVMKQLWHIAEQLSPIDSIQPYNQALMDIGATICTRTKPDCSACPVNQFCQANKQGKIEQFPHKKPKKAKPVREEYWPIVVYQGQIMLNQRPPSGIWGGLYSFNSFEDEKELNTYKDEKAWVVKAIEPLATLSHVFTHFQLNIHPRVIVLENHNYLTSIADSNQSIWHTLGEELEFGVPTPVLKLIKQVQALKLA